MWAALIGAAIWTAWPGPPAEGPPSPEIAAPSAPATAPPTSELARPEAPEPAWVDPERPLTDDERAALERATEAGQVFLRCRAGPLLTAGFVGVQLEEDLDPNRERDGAYSGLAMVHDGVFSLTAEEPSGQVGLFMEGVGRGVARWSDLRPGEIGSCASIEIVAPHGGLYGQVAYADGSAAAFATVTGCGAQARADEDGRFFLSVERGVCELRAGWFVWQGMFGEAEEGEAVAVVVPETGDLTDVALRAPPLPAWRPRGELSDREAAERLEQIRENLEQMSAAEAFSEAERAHYRAWLGRLPDRWPPEDTGR